MFESTYGTERPQYFSCDLSLSHFHWGRMALEDSEVALGDHTPSPCLQDLLADGLDVLKAVKAADVVDKDVGMDASESPAAGICPLLQQPQATAKSEQS